MCRGSSTSFGQALASGDFDNDGFADLAVGVPNEGIGTAGAAGAVNVLYGSAAGLTGTGSQLFTQVGGAVEAGDWFGWALAAGDFDDDGVADLAVGAPFEAVGRATGTRNLRLLNVDELQQPPSLAESFLKGDANEQHHHQQPSAAAVLVRPWSPVRRALPERRTGDLVHVAAVDAHREDVWLAGTTGLGVYNPTAVG